MFFIWWPNNTQILGQPERSRFPASPFGQVFAVDVFTTLTGNEVRAIVDEPRYNRRGAVGGTVSRVSYAVFHAASQPKQTV